jgi:hypothetical protein
MKKFIFTAILLVLPATQVFAQAPSQQSPITNVLVTVKGNPGVQQTPEFREVIPNEVRETVKLYLGGKISQWYSRADGGGVVFLMNASSVEEARTAIESLPLGRAGMVTAEYVPLRPLAPLGMLIAPSM